MAFHPHEYRLECYPGQDGETDHTQVQGEGVQGVGHHGLVSGMGPVIHGVDPGGLGLGK